MSSYRERLWPAPWMYAVVTLVIPATLLVFTPISIPAGIATATVLVVGCTALLLLAAPTIAVESGELLAGRARMPVSMLGETTAARGGEARHERGPGLDARAHLVLRGWVDPVLRIAVVDPDDPTPYWLVSTRRPDELAAAIASEKAIAPGAR